MPNDDMKNISCETYTVLENWNEAGPGLCQGRMVLQTHRGTGPSVGYVGPWDGKSVPPEAKAALRLGFLEELSEDLSWGER